MNTTIPNTDATRDEIRDFAQSISGDAIASQQELQMHHGRVVETLRAGRALPGQGYVLRCALYFEHRKAHHLWDDPDRALVEAILEKLRELEGNAPSSTAQKIISDISNCPAVEECLVSDKTGHPCQTVVNSQSESVLAERQIPEPWNGNIEQASILYVSSNPSISEEEIYPTGHWDDLSKTEFFIDRFRSGWVKDGSRSLEHSGEYSRSVRFWSVVRNGTSNLLDRPAIPGDDYALTEVVHCKSKTDDVATSAVGNCVDKYLSKILEISPAKVIGVMGAKAGAVFAELLNVDRQIGEIHMATLGNRQRNVVFLGGPGADPHPKSFGSACAPEDVERLRACLKGD